MSDYIAGQGDNDRRRAYLEIVTDRLVADLAHVREAWAPDATNYAMTFLALPEREAIGRIMNGMAVLAGSELMSERMAVGLDSGDQEDEHSCFSDTTHQDFVYDLRGIENVWAGKYPGAEARAYAASSPSSIPLSPPRSTGCWPTPRRRSRSSATRGTRCWLRRPEVRHVRMPRRRSRRWALWPKLQKGRREARRARSNSVGLGVEGPPCGRL